MKLSYLVGVVAAFQVDKNIIKKQEIPGQLQFLSFCASLPLPYHTMVLISKWEKTVMAKQYLNYPRFISILQLNDAYEEVDEQRQVVAQWKRKTQKVQGEMNDLKLLLEEQNSRNILLEKKQRKFDAEIANLNEEKKHEIGRGEKLQKEVEQLKALKFQLEDQVHVSTHHFLFLSNPKQEWSTCNSRGECIPVRLTFKK